MRRLLLILGLLLVPATVWAQAPVTTPPITAIRFVVTGGVSPVTNDIPLSQFASTATCPNPTTTVPNPTGIIYKVNATDTTCWDYNDPGTGPLLSLPVGGTTYTATAAYVNSNGAGPASAVSNPFARPGLPPSVSPALLKVVP